MMPRYLHNKSLGLLLLRVAIAVVFIYHGYLKLADIDRTTGFFTTLNFPIPGFLAYFVGLVELVGGLMLLFGVLTCWAAAVLVINMVVALLTAHLNMPYAAAELPIALLGGLLALTVMGGGKWVAWKSMHCCGTCGHKDGTDGCGCDGSCEDNDKGMDMKK